MVDTSRLLYWFLTFGRAYEGDTAACVCLILLMRGTHCHSQFACRVWSVALVNAMLADTLFAFRVAASCYALWNPLFPPKKDKAQIHTELALAVQNLGHVPCRSKVAGKRDEDKLRQRIDKARKADLITEEQYRSLIPEFGDDDRVSHARAHSKLLCEQFALEVQQFGDVPFRSNDPGRREEDSLRRRIEHAKQSLPLFAGSWAATVFEGLLQETPLFRQQKQLEAQFDEFYKTGSITEQQYRSLMSELESFLETATI